MKVAVIQASSQKEKNQLIYECVKKAVNQKEWEVINLGVFAEEIENYSYIETAVDISLLLESKAVDFVVTGCSSGQGMMLACNSLPGVLSGYIENPSDAYLFGRINDGNAVSFPLGLNFGWAGEINLQCTLDALFSEPFGSGYPAKDADRKREDTVKLKQINTLTKRSMLDVLPKIDKRIVDKALSRKMVYDYIMENGRNEEMIKLINRLK